MAVKIVTDSGADVPLEVTEKLGIVVVPLTFSFGADSFKDGVDMSSEQFYDRLVVEEALPTTSQPSVGDFAEVYKTLKSSGDEILSIHISAKLSGTLNSATQAGALENLADSIQYIDSQQASMGLGFSVIAAAEAAQNGASLTEAASAARSVLDRTRTYILFDTLKYLEKGGRIGKANALLGSVFQIKPILTLQDGEIATKVKVRTLHKGIESLEQLTEECGDLESAAILYTTDQTRATDLAGRLRNSFASGAKPIINRISPAVGAHGGPGVIGVVCVAAN